MAIIDVVEISGGNLRLAALAAVRVGGFVVHIHLLVAKPAVDVAGEEVLGASTRFAFILLLSENGVALLPQFLRNDCGGME